MYFPMAHPWGPSDWIYNLDVLDGNVYSFQMQSGDIVTIEAGDLKIISKEITAESAAHGRHWSQS